MQSSARTQRLVSTLRFPSLAPPLVLAALAACTSSPRSSPSQPSAPENAPSAAPTASNESRPTQQPSMQDLAAQKKELLLQDALEKAKALREKGDLEHARSQLELALQLDPGNAQVTAQYNEVLELLGERPGDLGTTRRNFEERQRVRQQSMKLEAEEYFRLGQEARARQDYDTAIRDFSRVAESIRWAPLDVAWGDLKERNDQALTAVKAEKVAKEQADRDQKIREAAERIKSEEATERAREVDRIAALLETANNKFDQGDYEAAIATCDQVLQLEPSNTLAKEMRAKARDARHDQRTVEYEQKRKEEFRNFKAQIDELRVPYSDGLTPADPDYWAKVTKRVPTGEYGLEELETPADRRVREELKTIRVTVNFENNDINTVANVLSGYSNINIVVKPAVATELETAGTLVTLSLTNVTMESALTIITKNLGENKYAWKVKNGSVQITTIEDAYGDTVIRTHAIQDLTFGRTDFKGPNLTKIALKGEYGDDPETSIFASDLEKVVTISPEDIVTLIRDNVAKETWELGEKKFAIDVASNQILVIHTPQIQREIEYFLNDLRRFTSTVVQIESRFVQVTDAFIQEIGVDLRGLPGPLGSTVNLDDVTIGDEDKASQGLDNLGTGSSGTASPSAGIFFNDHSEGDIRGRSENFFENPLGSLLTTTGGGAFQFNILRGRGQYNAVVRAVQKSANAVEIMAPEITVFNTERAYVTVLNEVSYVQDFDVDVANTAFIANPDVGILQEGVSLDVRPTISYDRKYVTLDVRTTIAKLQRPIEEFKTTLGGFTTAVTFQLPRLEVQNANTTVMVPDGGAVILGGLKTLNYVNRRAEVPWFARIPVIGVLFRDKGVADEKTSLVILVHAKIRDLSQFRENRPVR